MLSMAGHPYTLSISSMSSMSTNMSLSDANLDDVATISDTTLSTRFSTSTKPSTKPSTGPVEDDDDEEVELDVQSSSDVLLRANIDPTGHNLATIECNSDTTQEGEDNEYQSNYRHTLTSKVFAHVMRNKHRHQ